LASLAEKTIALMTPKMATSSQKMILHISTEVDITGRCRGGGTKSGSWCEYGEL